MAMRWKNLAVGASLLCMTGLLTVPVAGQFPPRGPGGGGGMPFGGFGGKGSFGGKGGGMPFGGGAGGGMFGDPSRMFDALARGRPYFLLSETRSLREPLSQYLRERGIAGDQITREQFTQFSEQMKSKMAGGGGATFAPGGLTPGGFSPGGFTPGFGQSPGGGPGGFERGGGFGRGLDAMNQFADGEFRRRDQNGDNVLNLDEMPDTVRQELNRWDTNRDGLMDTDEYRTYFMERLRGGGGAAGGEANPVTIILDDEIDKRPTVLRAGKLPKELKWFEDLDTDKDGQVALFEWRRGGKDMNDFKNYDRNDDGLMTPEEALRIMTARASTDQEASPGFGPGFGPSSGPNPFFTRGNNGGGEEGRGKMPFGNGKNFGGKDFSEFFKKKRPGN
jgi:hypothetical protein